MVAGGPAASQIALSAWITGAPYFDDLPEARTEDLDYENRKYVTVDHVKVLRTVAESVPFGGDLPALIQEFEACEARLATDCDQFDRLHVLKEEMDRGNPQARGWIPFALRRLREPVPQRLAQVLLETHSADWWFGDRGDWWVWAGNAPDPPAS